MQTPLGFLAAFLFFHIGQKLDLTRSNTSCDESPASNVHALSGIGQLYRNTVLRHYGIHWSCPA